MSQFAISNVDADVLILKSCFRYLQHLNHSVGKPCTLANPFDCPLRMKAIVNWSYCYIRIPQQLRYELINDWIRGLSSNYHKKDIKAIWADLFVQIPELDPKTIRKYLEYYLNHGIILPDSFHN